MKFTPTAIGERVETLDMIRGFSLLGIFLANMLFFHTPFIYIDPFAWFTSPSDESTFKWLSILVQGSFYPIFAMMFGYGMNMQYEKAMARGVSFAPHQARRLSLLLVFGLVHALLIWAGDILVSYAVMGFLLILFVRIPSKWLVTIAVVLYTIPMGALVALMSLIEKLDPTAAGEFVDIYQIEMSISAYAEGTFGEIFAQRFQDWLLIGVMNGLFMGLFMVLPLMMIGVALSKWKVIERANDLTGKLAIFGIVLGVSGLWMKALPFIQGPTAANQLLQETFGGVLLAGGYVSLLLLVTQVRFIEKILSVFKKIGRMSLTTYLMQSIIATSVFYSYGLGLYGKIDLLTGTMIAIGVFVIQVLFAELWLAKFRMGPFEWLWRKGTYGKNR